VLQCAAMGCNEWQLVAVGCSGLQWVAVGCSGLSSSSSASSPAAGNHG